MATMRVPVTVCDVCREDRPTRRWKIGFPDEGTASLDLCKEHESPLVELKKSAKIRPGAKGPRRRVVTEAEIKKAKKAPSKSVARKAPSRRSR